MMTLRRCCANPALFAISRREIMSRSPSLRFLITNLAPHLRPQEYITSSAALVGKKRETEDSVSLRRLMPGSVRSSILEGTGRVFSCSPFGVVARPAIEGLLRSDAGCGEPGVEIRAAHCLPLRQAFAQEDGEASYKGIAGAGAVNAFHAECRHMLHAVPAGQQRTVHAERQNDSLHSAGQQFGCALFCIVQIPYRHPGNRLSLTLIGNKVVEPHQRAHVDRACGSGIHDAANAMFVCEAHAVVNSF